MKEKIAIVFDDLNNFSKTIDQLSKLLDKLCNYYIDTDLKKLKQLIEGLLVYSGIIYEAIKKEKI